MDRAAPDEDFPPSAWDWVARGAPGVAPEHAIPGLRTELLSLFWRPAERAPASWDEIDQDTPRLLATKRWAAYGYQWRGDAEKHEGLVLDPDGTPVLRVSVPADEALAVTVLR